MIQCSLPSSQPGCPCKASILAFRSWLRPCHRWSSSPPWSTAPDTSLTINVCIYIYMFFVHIKCAIATCPRALHYMFIPCNPVHPIKSNKEHVPRCTQHVQCPPHPSWWVGQSTSEFQAVPQTGSASCPQRGSGLHGRTRRTGEEATNKFLETLSPSEVF